MSAVPWDLPLCREMNARRRLLLPGAGGPAVHGQGGGPGRALWCSRAVGK